MIYFGLPSGTSESNVKIFLGEHCTPTQLRSHNCTYVQPSYHSTTPKPTFEGLAYSRNVKLLGGTYLVYPTEDGILVLYHFKALEKASLGGDLDDEILIETKSQIQSIDSLSKTFTQDRIVVLTADGRILKIIVDENKGTIKRDSAIPDQIDQDLLFTDISVCGDHTVVAGYHLTRHSCSFVLLARNLEVVSRFTLDNQGGSF